MGAFVLLAVCRCLLLWFLCLYLCSMQNLKFPESWEQAKSEATKGFIYGTAVGDFNEAARIMAEAYEARIAKLEQENAAMQRFRIEDAASAIDDFNFMRDSLNKRIAELEKQLINPYPDTEANGWVFCGKCGQQK